MRLTSGFLVKTVFVGMVTLGIVSCGQKGPLYLPSDKAAKVASAPIPAERRQ